MNNKTSYAVSIGNDLILLYAENEADIHEKVEELMLQYPPGTMVIMYELFLASISSATVHSDIARSDDS